MADLTDKQAEQAEKSGSAEEAVGNSPLQNEDVSDQDAAKNDEAKDKG
ncbi:hypothetical protein GCM10007304_45050 [Rhodococcoides trifolii]|uniref:Uncharacterized protein n=1 Tax=Rhodococcoides trifolii TaxID=908250 RepID=A0A917G7A4_9NOCA|nr:hypothetical protein [Rhodococcus trifolii]GGG26214.1 hypothetical protein GCM10007304_45050 [Rhodococcus trifolii]